MKKIVMHMIPTFHHDIAYLKNEAWYTRRAFEIVDKALQLLEQDENYTFMIEQVYFLEEYWKAYPEKQACLKRYINERRLVLAPGFWSVPDMCMVSGESLFQNATYGRRFLKENVDVLPRTVLIADSWGHHAQLPQILTSCGYKYYMMWRCMERDFEKTDFRWQGLDGTIMPTHWLSHGYAGVSFPSNEAFINAEEQKWEDACKDGVLKLYEEMRELGADDSVLIPCGGDMMMPAESALKIVPEWQKDSDMPHVAFSTVDDAMESIDFSKKEIYEKEFVSALKGTFSTNIKLKQANRKLEQDLYGLEVLSVLKRRNMDFTDIWETALKNQFHDIICGTICDDALIQARQEYNEAFHKIEEKRKHLSESGEPIKFNALPFSVTELRGNMCYTAEGFSYADEKRMTCQQLKLPCYFENEWYCAEVAENGFIKKLTEKQTGKLLFEEKGIPFGSLLMEADSGDNWVEFEYPWEQDAVHTANVPDPYDRSGILVHPKTKLKSNGVKDAVAEILSDGSIRITQSGSLNYWQTKIPFTVTTTLSMGSPRIDYHTEFECTNNRIRLRVAFPTELEGNSIRHQIPYGMVERGEGTQPLEYFMDQQEERAGLALINRGLPANNTEGGIMMLTLFRSVAMEYKCKSALSYNLGEHITCDYAVVPHAANQDQLLWEQALAFQRPLIETTEEELLPIRIEGAMISAMREDNGAVFLRVYNGLADRRTAVITLSDEFETYALTDGCMDAVSKTIAIEGNRIELTLSAFKIQGLKLYRRG